MTIEEYYLYDPNSSIGSSGSISFRNDAKSVKIAKDAITYVTSGLVDRNKQTILSYLHKPINWLTQYISYWPENSTWSIKIVWSVILIE